MSARKYATLKQRARDKVKEIEEKEEELKAKIDAISVHVSKYDISNRTDRLEMSSFPYINNLY